MVPSQVKMVYLKNLFPQRYSNFQFQNLTIQPFKKLAKTLSYIETLQFSNIKKKLFSNFLYQGKERPAKKKLVLAKLCTVLANFGLLQIFRKNDMFLIDIHFFSLTPHNVSLHSVTYCITYCSNISAKTNFSEKPYQPVYQGTRWVRVMKKRQKIL